MSGRLRAVLLNDTRVDAHHGCTRVVAAIEELLCERGVELGATCPAHVDWRRADVGFRDALDRADLILVNGEGTIHHDRPAGRWLLEVGPYARKRRIPAALINAGWEANGAASAELASHFSIVAVRDEQSAAELRAAGLECRVVPDLSLYQSSGRSLHASRPRRGIGFTDSVLPEASVELSRARRRVGGKTISIHRRRRGPDVLRFLRGGIARTDLARPRALVGKLRTRVEQWAASSDQPEDLIEQIGRLQLLVSGRYHACMMALLVGTPFVAVRSNTSKIEALVADVGLDPWRTEAWSISDWRIVAARGWSAGEREAVGRYVMRAREEARRLFRDIA